MNVFDGLKKQLQSAGEPVAPGALDLIHSDHEEVDALFKIALSDSSTLAAKRSAIDKVCFALVVHAKMEEKIFYPALRKAGKQDEKDSVLEAAEEHGVVKDLIGKIKRIKGRDETLEAKVTVLKELVEHHVKEEESTMFDEARKVLGKKLQPLGAEMVRFKERAGAAKPAKKTAARKATSPAKKAASKKR